MPGSGLKLPLNLHEIGARCSNAYFAPKRFAAVQLAFSNPRCRVLVFRKRRSNSNSLPSFWNTAPTCLCADTGRLVGTGARAPLPPQPA